MGKVALDHNDVGTAVVNGKTIWYRHGSAEVINGQTVATWSLTATVACAYVQ